MSITNIDNALKIVRSRIAQAMASRPMELGNREPRLVAVSKIKPKECIIEAYRCGQRHFGENYVNELVEKSTDSEVNEKCPEIKWHYIGHLQKNKVNKLLRSQNLFMVETVDSREVAEALNRSLEAAKRRLKIMVQVNTSGESSKSGIAPDEVTSVVEHIRKACPSLEFSGLMTIGAIYDPPVSPNPDFQRLIACRSKLSKILEENQIELSMGMSDDFEEAIRCGSTNIRLGSIIFGAREYPAKKSE